MIYLLDNNEERQKTRYNIKSFDYKDVLKIENVIDDVNNTPFLDNASCILFHASFPTKGLLMKIRNEYDEIPKVFFSNDYKAVKFTEVNFIQEIRSDVLYRNLRYFLEDFRKTKQPNLKILAFGENYKQAEVSYLKDSIYFSLFDYDYETTFDINWLKEEATKAIEKLYHLAFSDSQFEKYYNQLSSGSCSVGQFLYKIDALAQKIK